jgi:spore coat polysaccharide biosynthesis protein SpsF
LRQINAHVRQKEIAPQGGIALIRCDGGGGYGFGHVKRMIVLARALRDREGIGAVFAVNGSEEALAPIRQAGFEAKLLSGPQASWSGRAPHPDICILDCRDGPTREALAGLVRDVPLTAVIDDASERRLAADFAYYPPVPQADDLDWQGSDCTVRVGWEWALLGLPQAATRSRSFSPRPTLLVTMGGSDPYGMTLCAARALAGLDPLFRARFVIGPGFEKREKTAQAIVALKANFETVEGADSLTTEYASADLALAAFGVTAYELAAFGVPALYLCATEDHALSASAFELAGMGVSLGLAEQASDDAIAKAVWALLSDAERRREMRSAGLMTIDGNAAARIASDLAGGLAQRRAGKEKRTAI